MLVRRMRISGGKPVYSGYECDKCHKNYGHFNIDEKNGWHFCPWCGEPLAEQITGSWPRDSIKRAFVDGAAWWEFHQSSATMWQSDRRLAEEEAVRRYPDEPAA